jgi:hypothetical protein
VKITPSALDQIFTVRSAHLEKSGDRQVMRISFSQPVGEGADAIQADRYSYLYHEEYGSPKVDQAKLALDKPVLSADGLEMRIGLEAKKGDIHHFDLSSLRSAGGDALEGQALYYQASELP